MSNFTEVQSAEIVKVYTGAKEAGKTYDELTAIVKDVADNIQKTVPQVRGVLVAEKVYVSKPKTATDSKSDSMDKEALVKAITIVTGKDVPSFKNASKKDLTVLWEWIVSTSDRKEADAAK